MVNCLKKLWFVSLSLLLLMGAVVLPLLPQNKVAAEDETYKARFLEMYEDIHNTGNGYFSDEGIPYHTRENLLCEAPDIGHESVSETMSYWVWLEAFYGKFQGDWTNFKKSWDITEKYFIPTSQDQLESSLSKIKANHPNDYAPELDTPEEYPAMLDFNATVGSDPLHDELYAAYGNYQIYGMHWIIDVDNWYGYGNRDDGTSHASYINTFQRGCQESTWETVPHPCWLKKYANIQKIFTAQSDGGGAAQWRYTNAPDADARQIQATYWAYEWAQEQGVDLATYADKAAKMGDYLRYSLFDKHFRKIGSNKTAGTGYDACHYLISWYYAWGGAIDGSWGWIEGCSHNHQGYQNPMAAYILSNETAFIPKGAKAKTTWATSMDRQLDLYQWLQSAEGAIAGGCTNSVSGRYETIPSETTTFYGMAYDWEPVWHDPPSNRWMGYQAWPMQRLAEFYYKTGNAKAKRVLDKWVKWALSETTVSSTSFKIPSNLAWSGQPNASYSGSGTIAANTGLHVTVETYNSEIGTASSMADAFMYYAAGLREHSGSEFASLGLPAVAVAKQLLDVIWDNHRDEYGVAAEETRDDYNRYVTQKVYVPSGVNITMPSGDVIKPGITFLDIRTKMKQEEGWEKVAAYANGGDVPTFTYHRWWHEVDFAVANAVYAMFAPWDSTVPSASPTATVRPTATVQPTATVKPTATAGPTPSAITGNFSVSYTQNDWGSGATVSITIKNNGTSAVNGWKLAFSYAGNQKITNIWNASYTQNGTSVTITGVSYNNAIPAGGSVTFGFNISYSGANPKPTDFTVNGSAATTN
jgi:hypothetical protein